MTITPPLRRPAASGTGDLVRAAAEGDRAAWETLVARHSGLIRSVTRAFRLDEEDAADVAQNTWLLLLTRLGTLRSPEALPGWLATTARHECHRVLRRKRERPTDTAVLDRAGEEPGPAELAEGHEVSRVLRAALSRLPERDVRLLELLMDSARPGYREIAGTLGMAIGSIGPRRSRALAALRAELVATGQAGIAC